MTVAGNEQRLLQLGETATRDNSNCSWERSEDRERREREEHARLNPQQELTPAQRIGQAYAESYRREQEQKAAERARLIAEGKIVINQDGSETHHMRGLGY